MFVDAPEMPDTNALNLWRTALDQSSEKEACIRLTDKNNPDFDYTLTLESVSRDPRNRISTWSISNNLTGDKFGWHNLKMQDKRTIFREQFIGICQKSADGLSSKLSIYAPNNIEIVRYNAKEK